MEIRNELGVKLCNHHTWTICDSPSRTSSTLRSDTHRRRRTAEIGGKIVRKFENWSMSPNKTEYSTKSTTAVKSCKYASVRIIRNLKITNWQVKIRS